MESVFRDMTAIGVVEEKAIHSFVLSFLRIICFLRNTYEGRKNIEYNLKTVVVF